MDAALTALQRAGARELTGPAGAWLRGRLARWGQCPQGNNLGGLLCCLPHDHTSGCVTVPVGGGRVLHLAAFPSLDRAAGALVATARRAAASSGQPAPDLPVGYTSTHPRGAERLGFAPVLPFLLPALAPLASTLTGPSAEAESTFRGLMADWEAFEREGVPIRHPEQTETHAVWSKFRDAWLSGRPDVGSLNSMVHDANRVRRDLAAKAGRPAPAPRPGVDIEHGSPALQAAAQVNQAAADAERKLRELVEPVVAPAPTLPTSYKVAGGAMLGALAAALYYGSRSKRR